MRKKDVVLMATVSSFESLVHPSRSELRQFAELFSPLFMASSDEARRDAVAALSQSDHVPPAVAFFVASQPIAIAAPFLTASKCLSDDLLITIARTQGEAHARAIVRREWLSSNVIDALVSLRQGGSVRDAAPRAEPAAPAPEIVEEPVAVTSLEETERALHEEQLRRRIKMMAGQMERHADDRLGLRSATPIQQALMVRFARDREAGLFSGVLADALSASRWLSDRILLDISGRQLATTLKGLGMEIEDALFIVERFYDHLTIEDGGMTRGERLWDTLDADECGNRVEAWRRADGYTRSESPRLSEFDVTPDAASQQEDLPPRRTSASIRPADPKRTLRGR